MSAEKLLQNLIAISPDFQSHWLSADNYHVGEDGTFSAHGAFSEYSSFVKEHANELSEDQLKRIGSFVSECMHVVDSDIGNAASTCFIENLSGEAPSLKLKSYLHGEALKFFIFWNPE
jgi:hypothetical protein